MKPTLVLVGRPNVGKSTLFNRLTRSRDAIVADLPGLTRDRHYGQGRIGEKPFIVVDTGGFEPVAKEGILSEMARQAREAIAEADVIVFVIDARAGLAPQDKRIAQQLRRASAPVILAVNKTEGMREEVVTAEFHELALGVPHAISAAHGEGVHALVEEALAGFPAGEEDEEVPDHPRVAIVGRPNVGKSTLINRLLGEERVVAFDQPGTTRDAIEVELERDGRRYTLDRHRGHPAQGQGVRGGREVLGGEDAAGDRARERGGPAARRGVQDVTDQDAHIGGYILEAGRALVVAVNKWDAIDAEKRKEVKTDLERKLQFLNFAEFVPISARMGTGIKALLKAVDTAFAAAMAQDADAEAHAALQAAVEQQQPPMAGRFRPKMRYAHQGGIQSPDHRDPRFPPGRGHGPLQALPRAHLPEGLQAQGHAPAHRAALLRQPLRGTA